MLTHRQRIEACIAGKPVDRPPVALWRHFPVDDQRPETLAAATLHWQKTYDWDLVKVTPASSFSIKDWGAEDEWRSDPEGTRRYTHRVITAPEDWSLLPILDADTLLPPGGEHLAAQIKCLSLIRQELPPDTPMIQTVFSPLAQAKNLLGSDKLLLHIRQHPEMLKRGLEIIAETTRRFIVAALTTGLDGVFYAVQHAQAGLLTEAEFFEFGRSFDLPVLEAIVSMDMNILHLHGENVYFDAVADYPVQIINWHDRDTAPSLAEGLTRFQGAVCGGLSRETLVYGDSVKVLTEAADAFKHTNGRRLLLGTGCVVPVVAPHGNILTVRKSVEK
jgi:uroporphyrinogen decarboxylase